MDLATLVKPRVAPNPDAGGHFYGLTASGKCVPAHTIIGKNGKERSPSLREVKGCSVKAPVTLANGTPVILIRPSVTTIFKVLKRGLETWRDRQIILAAKGMTQWTGESDDAFIERVKEAAFEQVGQASDLGTRIHAALEDPDMDPEEDLAPYVLPARRELDALELDIVAREKPFVSEEFGYGGTIDVVASGMTILDFKSRTNINNTYPTDAAQMAAYGVGIWGEEFLADGRCISLLISTSNPGLARVHEWSRSEIRWGWRYFRGAQEIWMGERNYQL